MKRLENTTIQIFLPILIVLVIVFCPDEVVAHGGIHESIERISKEIKKYPDSCNLYIRRGQYYVLDDDFDRAYLDYKKAQYLDKSELITELLLSKLFCKQSMFQSALYHVDSYLTINSNSIEGLVTRAGIYIQIDNSNSAKLDLDRAIGLLEYPEPKHFILIVDAVYNDNVMNYIEAVKWLEIGYKKLGYNIVLKEKEIELAIKTQNYDNAIVVLEDNISHFERKEKWLFRLGEIHELKNENELAIYYYNETIKAIKKLKPRVRFTKKMRATISSAKKRIEELASK